jgi:hypothetical protein
MIIASLGFVNDLRKGILEPGMVRGTLLDMDQYSRLFGTARIPTQVRLIVDLSCGNYADLWCIAILRETSYDRDSMKNTGHGFVDADDELANKHHVDGGWEAYTIHSLKEFSPLTISWISSSST